MWLRIKICFLQGSPVDHWQRSLLLHDLMQELNQHWPCYGLAHKAFQVNELRWWGSFNWYFELGADSLRFFRGHEMRSLLTGLLIDLLTMFILSTGLFLYSFFFFSFLFWFVFRESSGLVLVFCSLLESWEMIRLCIELLILICVINIVFLHMES